MDRVRIVASACTALSGIAGGTAAQPAIGALEREWRPPVDRRAAGDREI